MKYKNNPLNIRAGQPWHGLSREVDGFCEFDNLSYCIRSALIILWHYQHRRKVKSLKDVIYTWAPPSENNSFGYLRFVSNETLFPFDWKLDVLHPVSCFRLLKAMCQFESNFTLVYGVFDDAYRLFITYLFVNSGDMFSV